MYGAAFTRLKNNSKSCMTGVFCMNFSAIPPPSDLSRARTYRKLRKTNTIATDMFAMFATIKKILVELNFLLLRRYNILFWSLNYYKTGTCILSNKHIGFYFVFTFFNICDGVAG